MDRQSSITHLLNVNQISKTDFSATDEIKQGLANMITFLIVGSWNITTPITATTLVIDQFEDFTSVFHRNCITVNRKGSEYT